MALDTQENRNGLIQYFPQLNNDSNFCIKSEETPIYNCIAWAMGITDRWVDHNIEPGHWWPDGVNRGNGAEDLINAFKSLGFSITDNEKSEDGFDKVVLYSSDDQWTHAARVITDTVEHSKFGQLWDGTHSHNMFSNTIYGEKYAFMKRPIKDRLLTDKAISKKGSIKITKKLIF